ncbi:MAG: hypothetical protein N2C14_09005, partial [Planctomycetales bacterium]
MARRVYLEIREAWFWHALCGLVLATAAIPCKANPSKTPLDSLTAYLEIAEAERPPLDKEKFSLVPLTREQAET